MATPNLPVFVYDGDCGFCTASAGWLGRRLPGVAVEPAQALDLKALGLTPVDVATAAWWVEADRSRRRGHHAFAAALRHGPAAWPWLGRALELPLVTWLAAGVYALVTRYRYRLPGATAACELPARR